MLQLRCTKQTWYKNALQNPSNTSPRLSFKDSDDNTLTDIFETADSDSTRKVHNYKYKYKKETINNNYDNNYEKETINITRSKQK
eukprot:14830331-Ditylum_brightwellii.AAC.1